MRKERMNPSLRGEEERMELVCPACRKWIEVAERDAILGGRPRCPECWEMLKVKSVRPLVLQVESRAGNRSGRSEQPASQTGGRRA
jgi:hypothetical protein